MPSVQSGESRIHFEELGSGHPMLLIAPGGLSSSITKWANATINPLEEFIGDFHLVAMDQRNAGGSRAPFRIDQPWDAYLRDQIAVMDALGFGRFHIFGCCIGCSFALKLAHTHPDRVSAVVLEQPMGLIPGNQQGWRERCHDWVRELTGDRTDLDEAVGHRFVETMWREDFIASLSRAEVGAIRVPTCVLPGVDEIHPGTIGLEIAELIPDATVVSPWKDTPEHARDATARIREFLLSNVSRDPNEAMSSEHPAWRPPQSRQGTADAPVDR